MTTSQINRILNAIEDCTRFIDKEEQRNPATRPADIQKLLAFYHDHRAALVSKLEDAR